MQITDDNYGMMLGTNRFFFAEESKEGEKSRRNV